jgi:hypothetical protein
LRAAQVSPRALAQGLLSPVATEGDNFNGGI